MTETLGLALAGLAGIALGGLFFGGLWWTVRQGLVSSHPGPWFIASLFLRMITVLTGLWIIGHRNLERLLACLIGIGLARLIVMALARSPSQRQPGQTERTRHAS
jgi:F1F0 ATPase subunit 2